MFTINFRRSYFRVGTLALAMASVTAMSNAQTLSKSAKVGAGLYEIAVDHRDGAVYVASVGQQGKPGACVYKLDPQTLAVTDSIALGEVPGFGLGINQKTRTLYTTNTRSNSVHAIDLKTGKIVATITNGAERSHTREVAVDEKANKIYVSDVGDPSTVWVIDGKTNQYAYSLDGAGKTATGLAVDSDKGLLYVTAMGDNEVLVYHTKTREKIRSFPSGSESPINIALDKKGDRLFVTDSKNSVLTVLNASSGELLQKITVGENPIGVSFDAARNRIYTANRQGKSLTVVDGSSYAVMKTIPTEGLSNTVAVHPKTGTVYVTNKQVGTRVREGQTPPTPLPNGDTVSLITP
ncbi:40-residue YVTN family beta-propeller repeat-containing protein [Parapedobacter luteus]|uniref:40-residue YVTN family beta-propeller repeat-containing protein n=1 Tax=Parapedobacter luteus TaxID=623280 RepID=A0A1T5A469_9SPHI|nr:YncE family protein [Parapedobacter luteus]SKB29766.1 40-residue YVTN family beta-propeller repeat-containing protein [Parapedobacter luteus]